MQSQKKMNFPMPLHRKQKQSEKYQKYPNR
jgi:hypothetical protein